MRAPPDWERIMFPEIMRDEVFRLETRRLWLRWPMASDRKAVATILAQKPASRRPGLTIVTDDMLLRCIAQWRAEAEAGRSLCLLVTTKTSERPVIGMIRITPGRNGEPELDYVLLEEWRGRGLMGEAVFAMLDAAFLVGRMDQVTAMPRALDWKGRRVLERCGFTFVGAALGQADPAAALAACDMFCLDRRTWRSLKSWTVPDFGATTLSFQGTDPGGGVITGAVTPVPSLEPEAN